MKAETQHLDFLISQYVDGCLDPSSKKSIEQELLHDPDARKLYTEHRETQDLLDDWGNRIPLINWDEFDQKLASRIERETVGSDSRWLFRRWVRPVAVAASLFIAASIGYSVHLLTEKPTNPGNVVAGPMPIPAGSRVEFPDMEPTRRTAVRQFQVDEGTAAGTSKTTAVAIDAPAEKQNPATQQPQEGIGMALPNLQNSQSGNHLTTPTNGSSMAVGVPETKHQKDSLPSFP